MYLIGQRGHLLEVIVGRHVVRLKAGGMAVMVVRVKLLNEVHSELFSKITFYYYH